MLPPVLRQLHDAVSPDGPEHFDIVFEKLAQLWKTEPNLDLSELASLSLPTLLVAADHDMVTIEQLAAAQRTIPDAQLAIVPGADHGFPMEHPALLAHLLERFLV
jgi:pimeloyl-ACP methyl ester carboxylesterase